MQNKILAHCKAKQQESMEAQDWPAAQNYQDMYSMWKKRLDEHESNYMKQAA